MANKVFPAIALTGGGTGALDAIDGDLLADKDIAVVGVQSDNFRVYVLDAASGAAESSPNIIAPDINPGTKRWLLIDFDAATLNSISSTSFIRNDYTYTADQTITVNDADFIVRDTTDTLTQFIWRDHSAGLLYLGSENAVVSFRSDVGIGTTTPTSDLHIVSTGTTSFKADSTPTDTNQASSMNLSFKPLITSNGSYTNRCGLYTVRPIIDSGISNTGRFDGLQMQTYRNYHNGDAGDLSTMWALNVAAGHSSAGDSAPTTDEVVGLNISLSARSGLITNLYGLVIESVAGSNYTNAYGVYQSDADVVNYLNGSTGIGVTDPDTKLDVDGAITQRELSTDPSDPDEGSFVTWMSDGTGSGDDGDIMIKITAGGTTKTTTLVDFSTL